MITLPLNKIYDTLSNTISNFMTLNPTTSNLPEEIYNNFVKQANTIGGVEVFNYVEYPDVYNYSQTSSLLTNYIPTTGEIQINITEFKTIPTTITRTFLAMAMYNETGLNTTEGLMQENVQNAKKRWFYNVFLDLIFGTSFTGDRLISVPLIQGTVGATPIDINNLQQFNAQEIYKAIQKFVLDAQIYNKKYNVKGITNAQSNEDLVIVMNAKFDRDLITKLQATLFNAEQLKQMGGLPKFLIIPSDSIPVGNDNWICFIAHKEFFRINKRNDVVGSFYDPSNQMLQIRANFDYGTGVLDYLTAVKLIANYTTVVANQVQALNVQPQVSTFSLGPQVDSLNVETNQFKNNQFKNNQFKNNQFKNNQ